MFFIPLILAAGSLPTLISGAPVPSFLSKLVTRVTPTHLQERDTSSYIVYGGTGEVSDGWPAMSSWISDFETMFSANKVIMSTSCAQWNVADNTEDEMTSMYNSINSVASSTGIDARFIFAIVMQESNGCVRAPTTNYGVRNPGLMQSHNGAGTCNDGSVQDPCPASEITQMVTDGAAGTSSGDGLKQCLAESGATDVSMYYKAARIYNSGSIASTKNLGQGVATHCYSSDVANRLTGWTTAASSCNSAAVEDLTGTAASVGSGTDTTPTTSVSIGASPPPVVAAPPAASSVVAPPPASNPVVAAPPASSSVAAPAPVTTPSSAPVASPSTPASNPVSPSTAAPTYPYATASCQQWYTVQPGDYCILVESKFGISSDQLSSWNSGLDSACSNLWLGYQYCVKA